MDTSRRRLIAILATAALVATAVGAVIGSDGEHDFLRTSARRKTTVRHTAETFEHTTSPRATSTASTLRSAAFGETTPPPSPWQIGATTGLTNLAPVTITGTGVAPGTYYVGQCPANEVPSLNVCVLNDVVTVTDGMLASTVRVLWWLRNGSTDCGTVPGACVVGVMNARTAAAVASFPISFDPGRRPTIIVTPSDALTDGQSVVIQGLNFGAGSVRIEECVDPGGTACEFLAASIEIDGDFTTTVNVTRVIEWYSRGGPASSTCGSPDGGCGIEMFFAPRGFDSQQIWINPNQPIHLQFTPVSATTYTTTTSTTAAPTTTTPTTTTSTTAPSTTTTAAIVNAPSLRPA